MTNQPESPIEEFRRKLREHVERCAKDPEGCDIMKVCAYMLELDARLEYLEERLTVVQRRTRFMDNLG